MEKHQNTRSTSEARRKLLDGPLIGEAKDLMSQSDGELSNIRNGQTLRFRLPIDERMNWTIEWGTLNLEMSVAYAVELASVLDEALERDE